MKKAYVTLPLLVLLTLAGCAPATSSEPISTSASDTTTTEPGGTDQSDSSVSSSISSSEYTPVITEPVEVTIWTTIGSTNQTAFNTVLENIAELEPNITINNVYQNSMGYDELHDAILQGFPANNYPDLAYCYPDHVADYINANRVVDISQYMNDPVIGLSEAEKADYIDAFMAEGEEYSIEGVYSLPYAKSTEALYYDAGRLIGLDLSKYDETINDGFPLDVYYFNNLTWTELFEKLCPAIVEYNNDPENAERKLIDLTVSNAAIVGYDSDSNLFITLAEQYGYDYTAIGADGRGQILFNNAGMKELLTKFNGYAKNKYITSQGVTGDYTSNLFTANQCLFSVSSTAGVGHLQNDSTVPNVNVTRIPQAEEGAAGNRLAQISQGPSFTILDHQDEARARASWVVWKLMTSINNTIEWSIATGYMGIRHSFYESSQYQTAATVPTNPATEDGLRARNWQYLPTVTDNVYTSPVFKGSSATRTAVGGLMTWALTAANDVSGLDARFLEAENTAKNAL